jgi:hypothetical protein
MLRGGRSSQRASGGSPRRSGLASENTLKKRDIRPPREPPNQNFFSRG